MKTLKCFKKRRLLKKIDNRIHAIDELVNERNGFNLYSYEGIMADWIVGNIKNEKIDLIRWRNKIKSI